MALVVSGEWFLYFCYIDEAGCTGNIPTVTSPIQPIFVLCGLFVSEEAINSLTQDFLSLKRRFNPQLATSLKHDLDIVRHEIKGAEDLRKPIRKNNRNDKRRAIGFLDKIVELLNKHRCQLVAHIYIKSPQVNFDGIALYAKSVQAINNHFQTFLAQKKSRGITIADSRNYELNTRVSHSIFTQKFKCSGDAYPNIAEMPVYGHSDNHVAIQVTDIICSALLFPISSYAYCLNHIQNVHVNPAYQILQKRYSNTLKNLSFRYHDGVRYRGGITITDTLLKRSSNMFFSIE